MTAELSKCPNCGVETQTGTLGTMTYIGGMKWYRERSALALGGETIAGGLARFIGGMAWLDGHRCPNCRLLFLNY